MTDQLAIAGGAPIRPAGYPDWPVFDARDEAQLLAALRGGRWGGYPEPGPYNAQFCEQFAKFQGSKYGILMVNGTVTMEVALKALGIGWGDEVIVPGLTFAATAYAPMAAGAVPVVVDIDQRSWGIDAEAVEAAITPRTRAIIPVHAGQIVCDMDALTAIAKRHGLAIIEDCAHSPGKMWRGRGIGSFGEFGSFSHQSSKILTAGEGGTLLTDDEALARRAHSIIDCGRPKDPEGREYNFGCNYRLGELHAALLVSQLEKFPQQMEERAENARYFMQRLADVPGVRALHLDERVTRLSFYRFIVAINPAAFAGVPNRVVCEALDAEGVGCWVGYDPMSQYPLFQPHLSRLPVAVEYADKLNPKSWSLPVAEQAALFEQIYLDEAIFRAGKKGVDDTIDAFLKLQRNPDALRALARKMNVAVATS